MIEATITLAAAVAFVAWRLSPIWLERYHALARSIINADHRKVGGIRFIKIGRLTVAVSISRRYRPIGG